MIAHKHRQPSFWTPQRVPVEPVALDPTHPLAIGLIAMYVPGSTRFLQDFSNTGSPLLPNSSIIDMETGSAGIGHDGRTTDGLSALLTPAQVAAFNTGNITVAWYFQPLQAFAGSTMGTGVLKPGSFPAAIQPGTASTISMQWGGFTQSSIAVLSKTPNMAVMSHAGAASVPTNNYVNGALVGQITGSLIAVDTTQYFNLEARPTVSSNRGSGISFAGYMWGRALSADEAVWLAAEPFAMLRPIVRRTYSVIRDTGLPISAFARISVRSRPTFSATSPISARPRSETRITTRPLALIAAHESAKSGFRVNSTYHAIIETGSPGRSQLRAKAGVSATLRTGAKSLALLTARIGQYGSAFGGSVLRSSTFSYARLLPASVISSIVRLAVSLGAQRIPPRAVIRPAKGAASVWVRRRYPEPQPSGVGGVKGSASSRAPSDAK